MTWDTTYPSVVFVGNKPHTTREREVNTVNTKRPITVMKGTPRTIVTNGDTVEVWISSPTGDSSDTHIVAIPCQSEAQAKLIAQTWLSVWELDGRHLMTV